MNTLTSVRHHVPPIRLQRAGAIEMGFDWLICNSNKLTYLLNRCSTANSPTTTDRSALRPRSLCCRPSTFWPHLLLRRSSQAFRRKSATRHVVPSSRSPAPGKNWSKEHAIWCLLRNSLPWTRKIRRSIRRIPVTRTASRKPLRDSLPLSGEVAMISSNCFHLPLKWKQNSYM